MGRSDSVQLQVFKEMVENTTIRSILADRDFVVTYMNPASINTLRKIEHLLPCKVDEIAGRSVDILHKHPEHQRRLLAEPSNLSHMAEIRLGDEYLELNVVAIRSEKGEYLGPMVNWELITEKVAAR
ncbi:MAG: hypothetical protein AAFP90_18100 [Planctomycetota bacterium]